MADSEPVADQHLQVPFCRAVVWPLLSQLTLASGVLPFQLQKSSLVLGKFLVTDDCPKLQSI